MDSHRAAQGTGSAPFHNEEEGAIVELLATEETNGQQSKNGDGRHALEVPAILVNDLVKLFKLLSDETRLRILYYLTQRDELHVRALCELLGESQPAVSHHLALLRVAGLIERRREGKHNFYALQTQRFSKMLDLLFASMPEGNRRIRFEDYLLSHAPA
jgi:ArsR family transcriptional regulator